MGKARDGTACVCDGTNWIKNKERDIRLIKKRLN